MVSLIDHKRSMEAVDQAGVIADNLSFVSMQCSVV